MLLFPYQTFSEDRCQRRTFLGDRFHAPILEYQISHPISKRRVLNYLIKFRTFFSTKSDFSCRMSWAKLWLSSYQTPWRSVTNLLWRSPFRKWTSCCCSSWGRQFNVRKKRNSSKVSPIYPLVSFTEKMAFFETI